MFEPIALSLLAARSIQFAAVMILLGGGLFGLYAGVSRSSAATVRQTFDQWLHRLLFYAAALSLLSSVGWLLVQTALLGDGWIDAVRPEMLSTVLLGTEFGRLWILRIALACVALFAAATFRPSNVGMIVIVTLATLLVATLAGAGHAVRATGLRFTADVTVYALHLLAASIWLGGLVPLGFLLREAGGRRDSAWLEAAQVALPRFSRVGIIAIVALLLSGLATSWSLVGGIGALFGTDYGEALLLKVGLVLLMIGLAVTNRLSLMPKVLESGQAITFHESAIFKLARNVTFEQALGIAVLATVGVLGMLPPGGDHNDQAHAQPSSVSVVGLTLGVAADPAVPAEVHASHERRWSRQLADVDGGQP